MRKHVFCSNLIIDMPCRFCICHPFLFYGHKQWIKILTAMKCYCFNGIFPCSVHILGASDPNSGVKRIKYRFKAQSTGRVINNREYEYLNPTRVSEI